MRFKWISTKDRLPGIGKGMNILSENVLAKISREEYKELYYNHSKKRGMMLKQTNV